MKRKSFTFVKKTTLFIFLNILVLFPIMGTVPKRIVSLSPAGSEILCAIGAYNQIVARTDYCDWPQEMASLPSVGLFYGKTLSLETILKQKPDFVYGAKGMHDYITAPLKKLGIAVYLSDANSIDAVLKEITYMGDYTGHSEQANQVKQKIQQTFAVVAKKVSGQKPVTVYYEVWNTPYMSAGKNSFISELISSAGGVNIFGTLEEEYPMVSEEAIISRKPEVMLIPDMENETIATIQKRNGWQAVPTVKSNRVYFISSDICSRPGPRMTEALILIAKDLYPTVSFDDVN